MWHAYLHRRSEHWPSVYGTCTLAGVNKDNDRFDLKVLYSYHAPGERYADAGEFHKDFTDEVEAGRWADGLTEKAIPVRYNPTKSGQSILWDSELEGVVNGDPALSVAAAANYQPLESWEHRFLPSLLLVSGCGFVVSLAAHVLAIAGFAMVGKAGLIGLQAASIVICFPAAAAVNRQTHTQTPSLFIKSWPEWLRVATYLFFYYAILNFALCAVVDALQEPGGEGLDGGGVSPLMIRWFSAIWMLFFIAAFGVFYSRLRSGARNGDAAVPSN